MLQNMFKNMDSLYTEVSEHYSFDRQKYTIEEFFGDIKTFKDDFLVNTCKFRKRTVNESMFDKPILIVAIAEGDN